MTAILFKTLSLDRSSSPLFRRNLVWSYRLTSCCDFLPLFFRYRPNGFCNDNENVWSGVTAVGDAPLGALSRRKTLGCRRVIETNGTVWVSIAAPEKSMRTASTPDKRNVSLRPVVTVYLQFHVSVAPSYTVFNVNETLSVVGRARQCRTR